MDDLISRQAAIDACIRVREHRAYDEIEEIKALPSAERHGRWIPVTERLPEKDVHCVFVTYKDGNDYFVKQMYYGKAYFEYSSKICFYDRDSEYGDIEYRGAIAWMPLPEPFNGEVEENG